MYSAPAFRAGLECNKTVRVGTSDRAASSAAMPGRRANQRKGPVAQGDGAFFDLGLIGDQE